MISKGITYHGTPEVTLLEYGSGDIMTNSLEPGAGDESKYSGITCRNTDAHPVGMIHDGDKGKTVDEIRPDVVFTFTKVESIDVVMGMLQTARETLVGLLGEPSAE